MKKNILSNIKVVKLKKSSNLYKLKSKFFKTILSNIKIVKLKKSPN